jgi:hypothetical protein
MRIMKMLLLGAIGYAAYEFYQGMKEQPRRRSAPERQAGAVAGIRPGGGERVEYQSAHGAIGSQMIGRGVISDAK